MTTELRQVMKNALREQGNALFALSERVDESFEQAVETILNCKGRIIISGMGKSGLIGKKIAATFASTEPLAFLCTPARRFMAIWAWCVLMIGPM